VINKSGAWFSYGDIRIGQGREASKAFLKENPDLFKELRQKVLAVKMAQPVKAGAPSDEEKKEGADEE
jgi:recombination protein RecA